MWLPFINLIIWPIRKFFIGNLGFIGSATVVSVFECILKRIVDT